MSNRLKIFAIIAIIGFIAGIIALFIADNIEKIAISNSIARYIGAGIIGAILSIIMIIIWVRITKEDNPYSY